MVDGRLVGQQVWYDTQQHNAVEQGLERGVQLERGVVGGWGGGAGVSPATCASSMHWQSQQYAAHASAALCMHAHRYIHH